MDLMLRISCVWVLTTIAVYGQATSRIVVTQIVNAAMSPHATNWNKIPTNVLDLYLTTNDVGTFAFRSALALAELSNVVAASPADAEVLSWNAAMGKWTNVALPGGGDVTTAQLNAASNALVSIIQTSDITTSNGIVTLINANSLITSNGIINLHGPQIAALSNQVASSSNFVVLLLGTNIVGNSNAIAALATRVGTVEGMTNVFLTTNKVGSFAFRSSIGIQELTNVNLTSQTDGQALVWNDAAQKWTNGTVSGGDVTTAQLNAASNAAILVATQQVNAASSWTNDTVYVRLIGLGFTNMIRVNPTNGDIISYSSSLDDDSPADYQPGWALFRSQRENDGAGSLAGTHVELYATNNTAEKLHHTVTIKRLGGLLTGTDLMEYGEGTAPWSFSTITVRSNFVSLAFVVRDQPSVMSLSPTAAGIPYRFDTYTNSDQVTGIHTLWAWKGGLALGRGTHLMQLTTNATLIVSNDIYPRGVTNFWPATNGLADQVLTTDSSKQLRWADPPVSAGLITSVQESFFQVDSGLLTLTNENLTNWSFFDTNFPVLASGVLFSNRVNDLISVTNVFLTTNKVGTAAFRATTDYQATNTVLSSLAGTRAITNFTRTIITNVGVSTYTVPSGVKYIFVEALGAGGGGGGVDGANSQSAAGGGGGSGAYCSTNITSPAASYIVTIGAMGGGGAAGNNAGTNGGTTTFTNLMTAPGGTGGSGDASAAGVGHALGGAGAAAATGGTISTGGNPGQNGICISASLAVSGGGAGSPYGGGGAQQTAAVGGVATGYGAGGGGAAVITNTDRAGGNGTHGIIIVTEYYQ